MPVKVSLTSYILYLIYSFKLVIMGDISYTSLKSVYFYQTGTVFICTISEEIYHVLTTP